MNRSLKLFLIAAAVATAGALAYAQSVPEIPFDSNTDLLKFPDNVYMGEAAGVATNSKGDIYLYTRTGNPNVTLGTSRAIVHGGSRLFQFDRNGKFVREIGNDAYGLLEAQQVRVDPRDNVWIVDQMSTQVIKFDSNGRVQMVLSRKPEAIAVRAAAPGGGAGRGAAPEGRGGPPPEGRGVPAPAPPGGAPAAAAGGGRGPAGPAGAGIPGDSFVRTAGVAWDAQGNVYGGVVRRQMLERHQLKR